MTQSLNRPWTVLALFRLAFFTFLVDQSWRKCFMRMSWLVCVFVGTLAWGQAAQSAPPAQPAPVPADTSASVPNDAAVLTITGVCESPAVSNSSDCKTVITKAQ